MPLGSSLRRIRKISHQLERRQAGSQTEDVIFPLLDGVDEKNLQQREVQVEQHAQNAASHQHPDHVGMDVGRGDLGEVEKFFEQDGRGNRSPALNCSLVKKIELSADFSVDTAFPSIS